MNTSCCLKLPGIDGDLPSALAALTIVPAEQPSDVGAFDLKSSLKSQFDTVDCIAGAEKTPGKFWLAAQAAFPKARVVVQCQSETVGAVWIDFHSGEQVLMVQPSFSETETEVEIPPPTLSGSLKPSASLPTSSSEPKAVLKRKPTQASELSNKQLLWQSFLRASWGNQADFLRDAVAEAASREAISRGILNNVRQHVRLGERAAEIWQEVHSLFNRTGQGKGDFDAQFAKILKSQKSNLIKSSLKHKLEKQRGFASVKDAQLTVKHTTLKPVSLREGVHPSSLRHQAAQKHWEVLIDETGKSFGSEVDAMGIRDKDLGRIVALAVPVGQALPKLKVGFHAVDAPPAEVDKAVEAILENPVGVFGFTLKDAVPGLDRHWLSAVETMMRWVLRQLPFPDHDLSAESQSGPGSSVKFAIEQRDDYEPGTSLSVVCRMLHAELTELDPRFKHVHLSAEFIGKDENVLNGYVDAIAYTWGSNSAVSKKRLKASRFVGHCLLQPDEAAMERLYLAVDRHLELEPVDWYFLVANLQNEPAGSLAVELATRLGEKVSKELAVWRRYLSHVQMLMQQKRYVLVELAAALEWLQKWQPAQGEMPPLARLNWHSARLACANHFGATALADARASMALAEDLREEASPDACEADLRIAVAATNAFQFELAANALHHWIGTAPAIPGLKNWCKVQSSLGQHAAFMGEFDDALGYFDAALEGFARLTDRQAAKRDQQQTQAYRLITRMDQLLQNGAKADDTLIAELTDYLGTTPDKAAASSFFAQDLKRYQHHVFLRAMMAFPETFERVATRYLGGEAEWSAGKGHPWPLIDAYRAILLASRNKSVSAKTLGQCSLDALAQEESPLLRWMHCVLAVALSAAGIPVSWGEAVSLDEFDFSLPNAPLQALTDWSNAVAGEVRYTPAEIMLELGQCLPFNFH
ncbi:MAG: hypothetical protein IPM37_15650 [Hahellaceae bacterium]|nr:hypothetical protein [Hahellaceae bacterium]